MFLCEEVYCVWMTGSIFHKLCIVGIDEPYVKTNNTPMKRRYAEVILRRLRKGHLIDAKKKETSFTWRRIDKYRTELMDRIAMNIQKEISQDGIENRQSSESAI